MNVGRIYRGQRYEHPIPIKCRNSLLVMVLDLWMSRVVRDFRLHIRQIDLKLDILTFFVESHDIGAGNSKVEMLSFLEPHIYEAIAVAVKTSLRPWKYLVEKILIEPEIQRHASDQH